MTKHFFSALQGRRSYYALSKEALIDDQRIEELVGEAVKQMPSPFNSQSGRVVILLGQRHDRFWDIVKEQLQAIVPAESFQITEDKINDSFKCGYGTILYYEDLSVVEGLQQKFPAYLDKFPLWSNQSSGMLQFAIWTALELEGYGASLQHYNPVIDAAVRAEWDLPADWSLIAQMPFGKPAAQPKPKEFQPLSARIKLFK